MSPSSWPILAGVGVALVVAAIGWRTLHRRRLRGRIVAALRDPDPVRRRAGVLVATEHGLRANAALLLDHVARESDPDVLATVVAGVLRHAWEPSDHPAILKLRLWAHAHPAAADRASTVDTSTVEAPTVKVWLPQRRARQAVDQPTTALPKVTARHDAAADGLRLVPFVLPATDTARPARHRADRQHPTRGAS